MISSVTSITNVYNHKAVGVSPMDHTLHIVRSVPIPVLSNVALQYSHKGTLEYKDTRVNKIVNIKA